MKSSNRSELIVHGLVQTNSPEGGGGPLGTLEASVIGDLDRLHTIYSTWFAKQRPEPSTGMISKDKFNITALHAATHDQPAILAYFLSQGIKLNRYLIKDAVISGSIQVLQVLIDHGWNINEAEAYCEPPFLGYEIAFLITVVPHASSRSSANPSTKASDMQ